MAERRLLEAREVLVAAGDVWWLVTIDPLLCRALAEQDRPREFLTHADAFEAADFVADRDTLVRSLDEAGIESRPVWKPASASEPAVVGISAVA